MPDLVLERGEHVALVGPNGSGKTTLLETLLGHRSPEAGKISLGHGVVPAYFSQHEAELPRSGTVLAATIAATGLPRPQAQSLLGKFLFSGWEVHEKDVSVLSGGERRRLALALVVASGANLLVLDEPTNHLDLESREALEAALEAFPGTLLFVSHDRAILDAVPHRMIAVEEHTLRSYDGAWADLVRERDETPATPTLAERPERPARPRKPARQGPTELQKAEKRVSELEVSRSPRSRHGSPRTGRTSTCSRPIPLPARSSRPSSHAGRSCSRDRPPRSRHPSPSGPHNVHVTDHPRGGVDRTCTR